MNRIEKFNSFLEGLKGKGQDACIESIEKAFNSCMEGLGEPSPKELEERQKELLAKQTSFRHRLEDFEATKLTDFIHEMNNEYVRMMHPDMKEVQQKLVVAWEGIKDLTADWGSKYV